MRVRVWVVAVAVGVFGVSGCGGDGDGDGVASAGGGATASGKGAGSASPSRALSPEDAQLKFAQCMRENGVNVPDPGSGGDGEALRMQAKGAGKEKLQAAMKKCQSYLQAGGRMPDLKDPKVRDQYVKFAQCMRQNGVNVPDPGPDGSLKFGEGMTGDRAKMDKARKACGHLLEGLRK